MKAKFIFEILKSEDKWADREIENWKLKKKGINPARKYVEDVVNLIWEKIPEHLKEYSGITKYIIEDLITEDEKILDIDMDVYNYYEDNIDEEVAADHLSRAIISYIVGSSSLT